MHSRVSNAIMVGLFSAIILLAGCSNGSSSPSISGTLPATGTVGTAYTGTLNAAGGTSPYTWTVTGLPAGLTASGTTTSTLTVSGTPTTAATYSTMVTLTDAKMKTATYSVSIVISSSGAQTLTITPTTLGTLTSGTAVTPITLTSSPATTQPYTWTVSSGTLPAGLVLNNGTTTSTSSITSTTNSITISGTPTASGAYSFTLSIADSATTPGSGSQAYSGTVAGAAEAACAASPALRGNEAALTAPFALLVQGEDSNDYPIAWAGSFTPNGSGGITAADIDFIGQTDGPESLQVQLSGSSYSFGSDGRGCLYLAFSGENDAAVKKASETRPNAYIATGTRSKKIKHLTPAQEANAGTVLFSFSLSLGYGSGRITEFDYINSGLVAAGNIHQQKASDFSLANLGTNYAFGVSGWTLDPYGYGDLFRAAIAGSFANATGSLGSGTADVNVGGDASGELSGGNGTLNNNVSTTTGRGTGTYTIPINGGSLTFDFAYYVINATDFFIISTDDPQTLGNYILSGRAIASQATSTVSAGYYMSAFSGIDLDSSSEYGNNIVGIGTVQLAAPTSNTGSVPAATFYVNDAGTFTTTPYTTATYTLEPATGRLSFTELGTNPPVSYLTANANEDDIVAFLVGTDPDSTSGAVLFQTATTPGYSLSSLQNGYAYGTTEDVVGISGSQVGQFLFGGDSSYTAIYDLVSVGETASQPNQTTSGTTLTINSDGSGSFGSRLPALVTNGTVVLAIDSNDAGQPMLYVFVQQTPAN